MPNNKADDNKQEAARQKQFIKEAATLTERLLQFDRLHVIENNLSKEHRAFAAALYCINLRETYPGQDGETPSPADFDKIAQKAAEYYDANVPKKK